MGFQWTLTDAVSACQGRQVDDEAGQILGLADTAGRLALQEGVYR